MIELNSLINDRRIFDMPRQTAFNDKWIKNSDVKDRNGHVLSTWCQAVRTDKYAAHCIVCSKTFSVANMGLAQIQAHADGRKHIVNMGSIKGQTHFTLNKTPATSNAQAAATAGEAVASTSSSVASETAVVLSLAQPKGTHWIPVNLDDKVKQAEILFALKLAASNYSFRSYADIVDVCKAAFADSQVVQHMQLGASKVSYTIAHGLAPHFKAMFVADCRAGTGYYTIHFDETTTRQVKKQMDMHISFWSEKWKKITTVYIDSVFLGHASADKLEEVIVKFIEDENLDMRKLLQFSMDGPNVNLSFLRKMNSHLLEKGVDKLIDIGSCSLHPVHTAFTKGVEKLPFDIEQFSNDVFSWFKLSSARREDYNEVQSEELLETAGEFFLRPVSSRWLSMEPVCRRLIEQFPVLKKYFMTTIPQATNSKSICSGDRYKRIKAAVSDPVTLVYLNFIAFVASNLTPFLTLFQKDEPLVHVLHEKLNELVRTLMLKFMKADIVGTKEGKDLVNIQCDAADNWRPVNSMDVGNGTNKALAAVTKDEERKKIRYSFRTCLVKTVSYMQKQLPLSNPILRDLQCLHPLARKTDEGKRAFVRLCMHFAKVTKTDAFCDKVQAEWSMYMCETNSTVEQWSTKHHGDCSDICGYWNSIAQLSDVAGDKKYENLVNVVKSALSLSHGNAAPERGFSVNNSLLSKERLALGEQTICAVRVVKEAVRLFGAVTNIPITKELIASSRRAYAEYALVLEKEKIEKKAKEEEQQDRELVIKESMIVSAKKEVLSKLLQEHEKKESEQLQEQETAKQLINEASTKLSVSLKNNDLSGAKVAQVMLSAGNLKLQDTSKQLCTISEEKEKCSQKLAGLERSKRDHSASEPAAKKKK